jgi:hypothetical protein
MMLSRRVAFMARAATGAVCLACATFALAAGSNALAASVIHFQPEGLPALKAQLGHHEVHALTFHPGTSTGHIHVSMNDGRHMTVPYATSEQAQLVALAGTDGTPVAIAVAKPKAKAPVHHKLRYIAAGILVAVIVVIAAVLLVDRRRKLGEAGGGPAAESAPLPSSPGDPT